MLRYVLRDLRRNPRRTLASVAGVALAVGLFSGISLFVDSAASQMTTRAIAPVLIDMQAGVNSPLASPLTLTETVAPAAATSGQVVTVTLTVTNTDTSPATGVALKDTPPGQLRYLPSSTIIGGHAVTDTVAPDTGGPASPLVTGLSVVNLQSQASAVVTYRAMARSDIVAVAALPLAGTVQSTENPLPVQANAQSATDIARVLSGIRAIPGVAGAEVFASADFPAGSLHLGSSVVNAPLKVVAMDSSYVKTFRAVSVTSGAITSGGAVLSQPAADLLNSSGSAHVPVLLTLPGQPTPISLALTGIADFSQATQLFVSRSPDTQGEFLGAPYVVVVDVATFEHSVLPALRTDAGASVPTVKTPPVLEVHVRISRTILATDPSSAAITSAGLRRTIERVAPGEITAVDNLSDALVGAKTDSILAKVLFIFLGLPGVLLAAYLSRYAGSLLAQAQRRERATLRARGIRPGSLLRALAYSTGAVALIGSLLGLGLSMIVMTLLYRGASSLNVGAASYLTAAGLAVGAAVITTSVALYLPGRRALLREVADERREMDTSERPVWLRMRADLILLATAAVVSLVTYLTGGYKPAPAAEAQSVSLSFYVLLAPLLFWVGASLLAVRGLLAVAARRSRRMRPNSFGGTVVRTTLILSVLRRPQAAASGIIALSLAIAFGVSLTAFVGTYQAEKLADAQFVVGGDVRVTTGAQVGATSISDQLRVPGVESITPLAQSSSVVVGTDKRSLVAIDPRTFDQVAHTNPSFLTGATPTEAMAALRADPNAVLIDQEIAKTFNIQIGDPVKVQIPSLLTGKPVPFTFRAVAAFTKFPGFPPGVDFVANLSTYQTITGSSAPDFYLLSTDGTDATNAAVVASIQAGSGKTISLLIETSATAVSKEQSTLSALNVSGLGGLEVLYTLLMAALSITIFVFGLLLQRRKEHVTMRALGLRMAHLQGLIIGEAGVVTLFGLVIGAVVGTAMAVMSVQILQPVFTIPPPGLSIPWATLGLLSGLIVAAMLASSLVAGIAIRRAALVEILREE